MKNQPRKKRKPLIWLAGEVKTPPFSAQGRKETGDLLRFLQEGERLGMPHAEPLPSVGARCGALRIRDRDHRWRIMYRVDPDAIIILEVYPKKTPKIPKEIIQKCKQRLAAYDAIARQHRKAKRQSNHPPGE